MTAPTHRTFSAKQFQLGHRYEALIDPDETLDHTWEFADAFPAGATAFALSGTVDYGEFTAPVAAVVDTVNKTVTLYITGTVAGISSNIVLRAGMTINSTTVVEEVSFLLRCRNSTGQVPGPVTSEGYYALAADLDIEETAREAADTALTAALAAHIATSPTLKSGLYYPTGLVQNTVALTNNLLYAVPHEFKKATSISELAMENTTSAGGAVVRLGIYADSGGYPGALLVQSLPLDASANGVKTFTTAQTLPAGLYWFALVVQGGSLTVRSSTTPSVPIGTGSIPTATPVAYTEGSVAGVLTNPWTGTVAFSTVSPRIWFKIA